MGLKENVLELVKTYPDAIVNYNSLYYNYWLRFDKVNKFGDIIEATSCESIGRAFRFLVAQGKINVPKYKRQERKDAEEEFREEYGNASKL
jgi:hypothetical protein